MSSVTEYESRRLEKIKRNAALLSDLGLEHNELGAKRKQPTPTTGPKAKRQKTTRATPAIPTRVSARIASVPSKPVYNEDEAQQALPARDRQRRKPRTQPVSTTEDVPAVSTRTVEDVEQLRAGWTSWTAEAAAPTRDENGTFHFPSHAQFTPNKSPAEMLREGVFGGSYFRRLYSKALGTYIEDDWKELPGEMLDGVDTDKYLTSPTYEPEVNKYGVKCGQSIEEWEAAGWIHHSYDVRGWFQWYTRFFMGRRCEDDDRQVGRWARCVGARGRFRRGLLRWYMRNGIREVNDEGMDEVEISPVVHQTCLHWAWELRQDVLDETWRDGL